MPLDYKERVELTAEIVNLWTNLTGYFVLPTDMRVQLQSEMILKIYKIFEELYGVVDNGR